MATYTVNLVCDNSTLANFKAWGQGINTALSTLGWVQTADTGQVNWSTVSSVPSNAYVYEIWHSTDPLEGTLPMFLRIDYGYSSTLVGLKFTAGTGSNGAGTITNATVTQLAPGSAQSNRGATLLPCYFSNNVGGLVGYLWQSNSLASGVVFNIERSRDTSGNPTAEYFTLASVVDAAVVAGQQCVLPAAVGNADSVITGLGGPSSQTGSGTGFYGGTVAAYPVFPMGIGKIGNPMLNLLICASVDVVAGATVTVTSMYGSSHVYIVFKSLNSLSGLIGQRTTTGANLSLLTRYE